MSDRSWFFASNGQQQGPYPEAQFRDFIVRGAVTADTLVWTEGMAGWQKAGEIPGLLSGGAALPTPAPSASLAGGVTPLSIELGLWSYLGRGLLYVIGLLLVIPAPWAATGFYRWIMSHVQVPGRPNFAFDGKVGDLWYVFVLMGLASYAGESRSPLVELAGILLQAALSWMVLRWIAGNLSSNGQPLPITFKGSALGYFGWYLLMYVSIITIIGWAWVITAWMRWICRNISGTRREVAFAATGWQMLWRTLLLTLGCVLIIPIPWAMRWYTQWYVSQFELIERGAAATGSPESPAFAY